MKSSDRQTYEQPILGLLSLMMLADRQIASAPLPIMHKYFLRNENYRTFFSLVLNALPVSIFKDDSDWAADIIIELRKHKSKNTKKMQELYASFGLLRKFMVKNKMFLQELTPYPDPEVDAKWVIDSFVGGKNATKT